MKLTPGLDQGCSGCSCPACREVVAHNTDNTTETRNTMNYSRRYEYLNERIELLQKQLDDMCDDIYKDRDGPRPGGAHRIRAAFIKGQQRKPSEKLLRMLSKSPKTEQCELEHLDAQLNQLKETMENIKCKCFMCKGKHYEK